MHNTRPEISYRLSPAQKIFEVSNFDRTQGLNVEQVVCRTTEAFDQSAFRQSWQALLDHHSALRVSFRRDDALEPYQEIHPPMEFPMVVEDRQNIEPSEREAFLEGWLEKDRQENFNLATAPLMRVTVIRFAPDSVTWVWTFHHILMDGRSFLLVMEDFFAWYEAACSGRSVVLPGRKHFAEFMSWHQSWVEAEGESSASFLRGLFGTEKTSPVLSISLTSSPPNHRQKKVPLETEAGLTENLHRFAAAYDLTVNAIIQGAWALLLSQYYRSKAVTFATIRACRRGSIQGTEEIVGLLMNILPVHARISDTTSVVDFLKAIREQQLAFRPHQWTPWEIIRGSIPVVAVKQLSDSCVLFERYNIAQEMTDRFGKNGARTFSLRERANIPLLLSVSERPEIRFELSYQTSVFKAEDIERLSESFLFLLHQILETPGAPVGELELFGSLDSVQPELRFPLSDLQKAYLATRTSESPGGGCHAYYEFERTGIDVARLQVAWRRLINRNDMLRFRVTEEGEGLILPQIPPWEMSVLDLVSMDSTKRERELAAVREEMAHRSYDPRQWPSFDLRVSRLPENRCRLHFGFDQVLLDAASVQRVLAELRDLYENPEQAEPRRKNSFRDYALAQQSLRESKRFAEAQAYWERRLSQLALRPILPVSTHPKLASPRFVRHSGVLAAVEWERLRRIAGKMGLTPTAFLAAAFSDVLGKWCNQRHFTLNLVRIPRLRGFSPTQAPAGNFTRISLLAVNLDGSDFATRARELMKTLRRDVRHDLYSGVHVLRAIRLREMLPDQEGMPVTFTSLLAPRGHAEAGVSSAACLGKCIYGISQTPRVWLDHQVSERDGSLIFHWDAVEALFPSGLIEDMFSAYTDYLHRLVSELELGSPVGGPDLPTHQRTRRVNYNATKVPYVPGLLHAGFFATARKQASQIAVDDPERRVSYGDLAAHAYAVARRLREAGIGAGSIVAVVMEKGWEQLASVFGILRAGAAYLPIDPELPASRIQYLLSNGRVAAAFTQAHLMSAIAWPAEFKTWTLAREADPTYHFDGPEPSPDSLAYVIYTSGSTGVPKGVMITHQAALNTVIDINRRLEVSAADRVLAVSALSFDLSVYDIFGILERGGMVVLPAPERARDPAHWIDRMTHCGVTIWNSAPALMHMLITILEMSPRHLPTTLRSAMLSGDWIPVDLPERLGKFAPNCRLLSLGGATEVSIWSIAYPIDGVDPNWTSIPYGMPLANQSIHVLDDRFEPCPEWTAGEIYIGGDGLALGYLEDKAKTAERFLRSSRSGEMLYRTGDYGRFRSEGFVEFLGRKDTQVKIRGHRIEIGEVEVSLLRLPGVREAAVLTVAGTLSNQSAGVLVGCVVLDQTAVPAPSVRAPDGDKFRTDLAELLPTYMIPSRIIVLDALPLSANGKVDRRALLERMLPTLGPNPGDPDDEPNDVLEKAIWNIWQEILPGRRITRHDHFYELGGDSLTVLHMLARVEKVIGRPIGLGPMQQGGTILDIAAAARDVGPSAPPPMMVGMQVGGSKPPLFFAHGDLENGGLYLQRMSRQLGSDQPLYSISPHGTFGGDLPSTFEEIAASFLEVIRSVQPKGPYHLGGFCNGALAMYEVAQQLLAAGESVSTLVMLDPPDLFMYLSRRKIIKLGKFIGLPEGKGRNTYQRIAEGIEIWQDHGTLRLLREIWSRWIQWTIKTSKGISEESKPKTSLTFLNNAYYDAMARYEPRKYGGPVWVIIREGERERHPRQKSYWSGFIPDVHYEIVPGTHLELRGTMAEIAAIVETALRNSKQPAA